MATHFTTHILYITQNTLTPKICDNWSWKQLQNIIKLLLCLCCASTRTHSWFFRSSSTKICTNFSSPPWKQAWPMWNFSTMCSMMSIHVLTAKWKSDPQSQSFNISNVTPISDRHGTVPSVTDMALSHQWQTWDCPTAAVAMPSSLCSHGGREI